MRLFADLVAAALPMVSLTATLPNPIDNERAAAECVASPTSADEEAVLAGSFDLSRSLAVCASAVGSEGDRVYRVVLARRLLALVLVASGDRSAEARSALAAALRETRTPGAESVPRPDTMVALLGCLDGTDTVTVESLMHADGELQSALDLCATASEKLRLDGAKPGSSMGMIRSTLAYRRQLIEGAQIAMDVKQFDKLALQDLSDKLAATEAEIRRLLLQGDLTP